MKPKLVCYVDLDFGDGTYHFSLPMTQLEELQAKTDAGPLQLLNRLGTDEWRTQDVSETIRLGLIGGGKTPLEALHLVRKYVLNTPDWLSNIKIARGVLMAVIFGIEQAPNEDKTDGEILEPGSAAREDGEAAA